MLQELLSAVVAFVVITAGTYGACWTVYFWHARKRAAKEKQHIETTTVRWNPTAQKKLFEALDKLRLPLQFQENRCILRAGMHAGGSPALWAETVGGMPEPFARLSVHIDGIPLPVGHVLVRLHQAPEGMVEALQGTGFLEPCGTTVSSGYVGEYAQVWRLRVCREHERPQLAVLCETCKEEKKGGHR